MLQHAFSAFTIQIAAVYPLRHRRGTKNHTAIARRGLRSGKNWYFTLSRQCRISTASWYRREIKLADETNHCSLIIDGIFDETIYHRLYGDLSSPAFLLVHSDAVSVGLIVDW
jgi:hypothetical protein